jgi:hypothetical protein
MPVGVHEHTGVTPGLMMNVPLRVADIALRAERLFGD